MTEELLIKFRTGVVRNKMNEKSLKSKIEFVEKMKRENPEAFRFLARASANLLRDIERDKEQKEAKEQEEE